MTDTYRHKGLRSRLVRELRQKGIHDERVLMAIGRVPRHFFVEKAFDDMAYTNAALPIGSGQTMSQPYTVAYQTTILDLQAQHKVLEIGTGSAYQTCVLAEIGATIFSIERQKNLYLAAGKVLETHFEHYYPRIQVFFRDGYKGLENHAPFDRILVTAAAPSIPTALAQQLCIGGILVVPIGNTEEWQTMCRITRLSETDFKTEKLDTFRFVPFLEGTA